MGGSAGMKADEARRAESADPDVEEKRRRIRNWALLIALLGLAALFYAIAMVRMAASHHLPFFD
jgi:fatty acid desaturase